VKFPADLDMNEFCAPELQEKLRPARELLHTQLQAKQEVKVRESLYLRIIIIQENRKSEKL
jgi:hypothetical protein